MKHLWVVNKIDLNIVTQMWCGRGSKIETEVRGGEKFKLPSDLPIES